MQPYLIPIDLRKLASSFNNLPEDTYTEGGYRFRRMSRVIVNVDGDVYKQEAGTIVQPSDVNGVLGDVIRYYEPISDSVFKSFYFKRMIKLFQGVTGWRHCFDVHQIRIVAKPLGIPTPVAPEGPHSDGYSYTMPFVVGHTNVSGGIFEVYGDNKILLSGRANNCAAVFDDSIHKHYASPIELIDGAKMGYWDTFVITTGDSK